jgi:hypothetical protein
MNRLATLGLAMLAGVAIGAAAVNGLNAQGKPPGGYAVVDISEIIDQKIFDQIGPKAGPSSAAFGGKYVVRTNNITSIDGTPAQATRHHCLRQRGESKGLEQFTSSEGSLRPEQEIHEIAHVYCRGHAQLAEQQIRSRRAPSGPRRDPFKS